MYTPRHFLHEDVNELAEMMRANSFATLVTVIDGHPVASHLPFLVRMTDTGEFKLYAHMARANKQWEELDESGSAMVIFQGPHAYVSPSWYTVTPAVPTWNYSAVHAYGKAALLQPEQTLEILTESVREYEAGMPSPWSAGTLTEAYLEGMVRGIVGFEITVDRLEGKLKMSQNRSRADQDSVIASLESTGDSMQYSVAALMRKVQGN